MTVVVGQDTAKTRRTLTVAAKASLIILFPPLRLLDWETSHAFPPP